MAFGTEALPLGTADVDVSAMARLIADPARSAMLHALLDGTARPAGELARLAGVRPATASAHLRQLLDAGLVVVRASGRHRYHALAGPEVAHALEALALIAPPVPIRSLRLSRQAEALRGARSCYDHLAGRLGVELRDRVVTIGPPKVVLVRLLDDLGLPLPLVPSARPAVRDCLDWTERRLHLAGPLPAAVLAGLLDQGEVVRTTGRGLRPRDASLLERLLPLEASASRPTVTT